MARVDLTGRTIVITGAANGLGAAYARECAARGARLVLTDINGEELDRTVESIAASGADVHGLVGDVSDPDFMAQAAAMCERRWNALDGWVNNAGIGFHAPADALDPQRIERMLKVNVLGTIYGTAVAAQAMRRRGGGSIVNVSSGAQFGMRHLSVYGATKGAVASFTYGAAVDLAECGIRVNAILPLAATQMTKAGDAYFGRITGTPMDAFGRLSRPDAVAGLVSFLLSDAAADVTNQVIRLDGHTLAVVRHPEVDVESAITRDFWSAEEIADAFAGPLRSALYRGGAFESPAGRPR